MTSETKQRIEQIRNGKVPEGYKKTKYGIFPSHWKVDKLGNYLQELRELTNEIEKYPVYSSSRKGLLPQSQYYDKREAVTTNLGYKKVPNGYVTYRHMSDDDIFRFNKNTTEDTVLVSSEYPVFNCNTNGNIDYILPLLNDSPRFKYYCRIQKMGGTRTRLYYKNLCQYTTAFPPLKEQQKIANILSAQDTVIECYEKKIEQLKRMKKYYLQNMFPQRGERVPKFRFKGYSGTWNYKKFMDLFFERREKTKAENEDVLLSCAIGGMFLNSELFDHFRGTSTIGYLKVKKNDLILSTQNLHLGNANVNLRFEHGIVSPAYKTYDLVNCDPEFIQAWIKKEDTKNFFLAVSTEGASQCRKNIEWDMLDQQMLLVPTLLEQKRIGAFFGCCETIIRLHQSKYEEEKKKKKALQQLLLTGIVRVSG